MKLITERLGQFLLRNEELKQKVREFEEKNKVLFNSLNF
jgi:hypothetical protein